MILILTNNEFLKKVKSFLKEKNNHFLLFTKPIKEIDLKNYENFTAIISYRYSYKIPKYVLDKTKRKFNFHPAPLPYYRGVRCSVFALLNNEKKFGASIHELNEKFDQGKIVFTEWFDIKNDANAYDISLKANDILWGLFISWFEKLIDPSFNIIYKKNYINKGKYYSYSDFNKISSIKINLNFKEYEKLFKILDHPTKKNFSVYSMDGIQIFNL